MAMTLGRESADDDAVIAAINTTPLVDVMLVLLIIFLITIPVVTHSVALQLPKERAELLDASAPHIVIAVDRRGTVYWGDTPVAGRAELIARLTRAAAATPQPEVQLRGDLAADYAGIGRVLSACQRVGIARISLITEPPAR